MNISNSGVPVLFPASILMSMLTEFYLKRSWGGEIQNVSVLVAIGVNEDGCREIIGAAEGNTRGLSKCPYQRCTVHFYRNIFSVTPRNRMKAVSMMLKAIHS